MIPYSHQTIDQKDIDGVINVLQSDWLTQGPKITEFEKRLANYCGAKYAVAVANGTAALHLAYLAAGFKNGDEIITTPNTFVATSNMMLVVGAKPKFCDVRADTWNIDENEIEKLITKKTKAIVPVHFAGNPCEMDKILKIAKKYKLMVIEDACHALGAKYHGKKIGSLASDMTIFSFHPVKSITTGEGGAILTNNKKLYDKLVLFRSHGTYKDKNGKNVMVELGFNYRVTDLQAALGISQLKKLDSFIIKRKQIAEWYGEELGGLEEIILPVELKNNFSAWHLYVICVKNIKLRDKLFYYLKQNGVGVNFHYPAVYSHPYYSNRGYKNIKLANEEIYKNSCITLPIYPNLSQDKIKYVCDRIKKVF